MFDVGDVIYALPHGNLFEVLSKNSKYYYIMRIKDNKYFEFHRKTLDDPNIIRSIKTILKAL